MDILGKGDGQPNSTMWLPGEGWEDLKFPAAGINPPGQVSDPDRDITDGTWLYDKAATEVIMGQVQMPHSWKAGSNLHAHVHWSPTTAGTGDVLWRLYYSIATIGSVFPAFSTLDVVAAAGGDDMHQLDEWAPIGMVGHRVSCMIKWKLARIGGDALDDYDADAKLLELDFHYRINSIGSGTEYPKF